MEFHISPKGHYVYSLWGANPDRPFYVGMTSSLMLRLGAHATNREVRKQLRFVRIQQVKSKAAARALEQRLIQQYQPSYNTLHSLTPGNSLHPKRNTSAEPKLSWRRLASEPPRRGRPAKA